MNEIQVPVISTPPSRAGSRQEARQRTDPTGRTAILVARCPKCGRMIRATVLPLDDEAMKDFERMRKKGYKVLQEDQPLGDWCWDACTRVPVKVTNQSTLQL